MKNTSRAKRKMSEFQKRNLERFGHELPISEKAYNAFRERIIYVNNLYALEPKYMLWLFDEYLCGRRHLKSGGGFVCQVAFMMLRPEIDRAIERSTRAREQARKRRARKLAQRKEQARQEQLCAAETECTEPKEKGPQEQLCIDKIEREWQRRPARQDLIPTKGIGSCIQEDRLYSHPFANP